MSEEEIALKLVLFEYEGTTTYHDDEYLNRYFYYLEKIKNYNFESKKERIQNQLDKYHKTENISRFELFEILDKIQELLKE